MSAEFVQRIEWGVYVDDVWVEWLPSTRVKRHGWSSPEEAVAHWQTLSSFKAFGNGREIVTGLVDGAGRRVHERVTFEVAA